MTDSTFDKIEQWLFQDALPWWTANGLDRENGGYVEQFTLDGKDDGLDYKRTRDTGRHIYVFSHAALLGWEPGREAATHGFRFLTERMWVDDEQGFARRTDRAGKPIDMTPDLYDYAFALFAFGWYLRATGDQTALAWAHRTLDLIEQKLRHPSGVGFWHETPAEGWRQQNPHMHLIEAALSVYEASKDERFATLAHEIVDLFQTKFFDRETSTLAEFFTDDWQRAPAAAGATIEPGHQFEWAWILHNYQRLMQRDVSSLVRSLVSFAEKHGVDPETGVTYHSVSPEGAPIDRGTRTWPNTERLKAAVALWELDGVRPDKVIASATSALFQTHLNVKPRGLWMEFYDADRQPISTSAPTSTLYHVFLGFAETLRIRSQLG